MQGHTNIKFVKAWSAVFLGRFIFDKVTPSAHIIGSLVGQNWRLNIEQRNSCACPTLIRETLVTNLTMVNSVTIITFVPVAVDAKAIQSNSDSSKLFLSCFHELNGTCTDVSSR